MTSRSSGLASHIKVGAKFAKKGKVINLMYQDSPLKLKAVIWPYYENL